MGDGGWPETQIFWLRKNPEPKRFAAVVSRCYCVAKKKAPALGRRFFAFVSDPYCAASLISG
jgi:hypothetical protein